MTLLLRRYVPEGTTRLAHLSRQKPANPELLVVVWDVQHGSATYIRTPDGKHIAIDLGVGSLHPTLDRFSPLLHLRRRYGVECLEWLILTHPHRDHLDDIGNLMTMKPRALTRPGHLTEEDILGGNRGKVGPIIKQYLKLNRGYVHPVSTEDSPRRRESNGGVAFKTFFPSGAPTTNLNNHSVVTVLDYAGTKMLIPGDNEPDSWDELLRSASFRAAIRSTDILIAPHHGRQSGYPESLFKHIAPSLTIISDGPASNTDASDLYRTKSDGWEVQSKSRGAERRRCVTTRRDGVIVVRCGNNPEAPYMQVDVA